MTLLKMLKTFSTRILIVHNRHVVTSYGSQKSCVRSFAGFNGSHIKRTRGCSNCYFHTKEDDDKRVAVEVQGKVQVGSSTIMLQDGLNIQELPILIEIKSKGVCQDDDADSRKKPDGHHNAKELTSSQVDAETTEIAAIKQGLARCKTTLEMFTLLEIIPAKEVTPEVATFALHRISSLRRSQLENEKMPPADSNTLDTFAWRAIVDRLLQTIRSSTCASDLLEGLKALTDCPQLSNNRLHIDMLVHECLMRVTKGQLSVEEACVLAHLLASINKLHGSVIAAETDKLWSVFMDKSDSIDENNMAKVYKTLPLFKSSQKIVMEILRKRTFNCWWKMTNADVTTILSTMLSIKELPPKQFLALLTTWINLNIHLLTEQDLLRILDSLKQLQHIDSRIMKTIERYMKARNTSIENPDLIVAITDFCLHFRFASAVVLDAIGLWFEKHGTELIPHQIFSIASAFGQLNYVPSNTKQFFVSLERAIENNFIKFEAEELVGLLLSCTYVQRLPLNFVRRLFNPFYLDKLDTIKDEMKLLRVRQMFQQLDTAMTMECAHYAGPMLHRDRVAKSLHRDGRLLRLDLWLNPMLSSLLGGHNKFVAAFCVSNVPLLDIYVCDYMFAVNIEGEPLVYDQKDDIFKRKVVIIRLPEHYTLDKKSVMGRYAAQERHLQKVGYEVIQMDYTVLKYLRTQQSLLTDYLKSKLSVKVM